METQNRKTDWNTSLRRFASLVWGIATYLGLIAAALWFAVSSGGNHPWEVAVTSFWLTALVNWLVCLTIEKASNNR